MSALWWQYVTPAGNAYGLDFPFTPTPIYQLMSGSLAADSLLVQTLVSASWSGEGGLDVTRLTLYDATASTLAPADGAVIKVWNQGYFNNFDDTSSLSPDVNGFTSISMVINDLENAWFTPYTEFGATNTGSYYIGFKSAFPSQSNPSSPPTFVGVRVPGRGSFTGSLVNVVYQYALTDATVTRYGVIVNAYTGSPQLSLEPVAAHPTQPVQGDIWFAQNLPASGTTSGLFYYDLISGSGPTAIGRRHKVVTTREDLLTTQSLIDLYFTNNRPSGTYVAVSGLAASDWIVTIGQTGSYANAGWLNFTWQGGIWMQDSGTVAVFGSGKNFAVPSGSLSSSLGIFINQGGIRIVSGNLLLNTGSILMTGSVNIMSGGLTVESGNLIISGNTANFVISGSGATATIRGNNILNVIVSGASSESLVPQPPNGTLFVNTSNFLVSVRENNTWYMITSGGLDTILDGGSY
jgi:hypothetical protein